MNRKLENYDDSDECQILTQPIVSVLIYGLCQVKCICCCKCYFICTETVVSEIKLHFDIQY